MKLIKHTKKYYLNRMRQGQITDKEVAKLLNTTEAHVKEAFVNYCQSKKPFRKKEQFTIEIINIFISFLSLAVILFTLLEMQVARNNAYRPDLVFSTEFLLLSWDKNGNTNNNYDYGNLAADIAKRSNLAAEIQIHNIGVGAAKNVELTINNKDNIKRLEKYILSNGSDMKLKYSVGKSMIETKSENLTIGINIIESRRYGYILSSSDFETKYFFDLSIVYNEILREICYLNQNPSLEIPSLNIRISYQDIQGKTYEKKAKIYIRPMLQEILEDGSGCAVFEVTME